jgi:hypothetical protein
MLIYSKYKVSKKMKTEPEKVIPKSNVWEKLSISIWEKLTKNNR